MGVIQTRFMKALPCLAPSYRLSSLRPISFFALARTRLSLDVPQALSDPDIMPHLAAHGADPEVIAAIAAMRSVRMAAVLVPVVERRQPTVLFTRRTSQLADHAGEIAFAGRQDRHV